MGLPIPPITRITPIDHERINDEIYRVVGAAMAVHRILGPGHLEAVYQEAFEYELALRDIPHFSKPKLEVQYKDKILERFYVPDLLVCDELVVEIKAESTITAADVAQIRNSRKCCGRPAGLLINFGEFSLKWRRFEES